MTWFYLALLAPLLFSIVVLIDDSLLRFIYKNPYLATAVGGFFATLPLLSMLIKTPAAISPELAFLSVLAGFLNGAYYFFYFKGLAADSPAIVIALFSLAPATIPFLAHFLLHEQLGLQEIIGFSIILLASFGLAAVNIKKLEFSKALLPTVIAVILVDIVSLIMKHVYQETQFYGAYMYFCSGTGLAGIFFLLAKFSENRRGLHDIREVLKTVLPIFIVAELLNIAAEFTLNLAISRGPVSLVRVIEGIQPMVMLVIALILYPLAPRFFRDATGGYLAKKFTLMAIIIVGLGLINMASS